MAQDDDINELGDERTLIDSKPFSVHARVALQLGRESISSAVTAITELVKNAFDADASTVRIRFKGLGTAEAMMVIEDDGIGMTADELANLWLVIGTANKARTRTSRRARVLTGEKGLGRLGLDRLCKSTAVQSIAEGAETGVELNIDWKKYENADVRLEQIKHEIYSIPNLRRDPITGKYSEYPHGLRLILRNLKEDWEMEALSALRAELALLVSPFSGQGDFRIDLQSGCDWNDIDGPIATPDFLLDAAAWKVTGTISDDGMVWMRMSSKHHNRVFEEGPMPWGERFLQLGKIPLCGELRIEFFFFPRKPTIFGSHTITRSTISSFLDKNQGIRIYRDGFRVHPYGSPDGEGDWLRLAFRRVSSPEGVTQDDKPGNWRVGYNQLIGAVFITREKNSQLLDQTNREGLVQGKAFAHLRAFAEEVIRFFELSHQEFEMARQPRRTPSETAGIKAKESIEATESALREFANLTEQVQGSAVLTPGPNASSSPQISQEKLIAIQNTLNEAKNTLAETEKILRDERESLSKEKDTLANLASLGILAAVFGHETLGWANSCANTAGWLERNLQKYFFFQFDTEREQVVQKLRDTVQQAQRIETFAGFAIGNVRPEKRRRTTFCVRTVIQTVLEFFKDSLQHRNIQLNVEDKTQDQPCRIRGYKIDWESVVVNLITNAVWAIGEKQTGSRQIRVGLDIVGSDFRMIFEDSGIGLVPGTEERIFWPTFSTKRNKSTGEVVGTGLGLTITRNFIQQNSGGTIQAIAKGELGGARFVVSVPLIQDGEQ